MSLTQSENTSGENTGIIIDIAMNGTAMRSLVHTEMTIRIAKDEADTTDGGHARLQNHVRGRLLDDQRGRVLVLHIGNDLHIHPKNDGDHDHGRVHVLIPHPGGMGLAMESGKCKAGIHQGRGGSVRHRQ